MRRAIVFLLPSVCVTLAFGACGARTGVDLRQSAAEPDAAQDHVVLDAPHDHDGGPDVGLDADAEAEADAPQDVQFRDVPALDMCPDAGATLVYVLTAQNDLYSFYPPTLGFTRIGTIACSAGDSPFSMAVDRRGIAYSVFTSGALFRIDTASAACQPTTYQPNSLFTTFGMGFVANTGDAGETLFVADAVVTGGKQSSKGLGSIDTTSYKGSFVGAFDRTIPGPELTGTADGRLFAFYTNDTGTGSHIVEVDKTTAAVLTDYPLKIGTPNDAYAFGFWGGYFWVFTGTGGSTVTRFSPTDLSEVNVTTFSETIVGAGVSTCAPE